MDRISVSASFGLVTLDQSVFGADELLRRADLALYEAKAKGRNQCSEWRPDEVEGRGVCRCTSQDDLAGSVARTR